MSIGTPRSGPRHAKPRSRARGRILVAIASYSVMQSVVLSITALLSTIWLGPEDRGVMVLGLTIGNFVGMVAALGTGFAFRARLPLSDGADRESLTAAYTWCTAGSMGVAALLSAGATLISAPLIDPAMANPHFVLAVALFSAADMLLLQLGEAWYADGKFARGGAWTVAMATAGLLGVVFCHLAGLQNPTAFLTAQSVGYLVFCVGSAWQLNRARLIAFRRFSRHDVVGLVKAGAPAVGLTTGFAVTLRADRYILGALVGPAAVGLYSLAASLSEASRMLPAAAGQLLLRETALGDGQRSSGRMIRIAMLVSLVGSCLVLAAGWFLIVPIFGEEFADSRWLLIPLLVGEIALSPYTVASLGLVGGGWTAAAGRLGLIGAVGAVTCYLVAASLGGTFGTAIGSAIVYAGLSVAALLMLRSRVAGPAQRERESA